MNNDSSNTFSMEAEQSVLGALLRSNAAVDMIGDLTEAHFYEYQHRLIFAVILKLVHACRAADVITVHERLRADGKMVEITYLSSLHQSMPSAANITHYCRIVRDKAMKRGLLAAADEIIEAVHHSPDEGVKLVQDAAEKIEMLGRVATDDEPEHATVSLNAFIEQLDAEYSGADSPGISTGLMDLDAKLNGGPRRGNLFVIAGRPKMGKTALALNIANHVATTGVAAVLSMEMSKAELHNRNVASIGRIDLDHLNDPKKMTDQDWPRLTEVVSKLNHMDLYLDDQGGLTLLQVRRKALQIKRKAGALDLLVIDYLQLMSGPGDNRNAQVEAITRGLKALAKELDCVILLLSQLNRQLEQRTNKRPIPADLRDSGSIEQDCDACLFVYRDEVYYPDSPDKGIAELILALNRHGSAGTISTVYLGQYTKFEDVARGWHPVPRAMKTPPPSRGID